MNIKSDIEKTIAITQSSNNFYLRNLVKEILQNYTLNFIYNSNYRDLIFTGGTCLRKVYGLNRLSEDLDFDFTSNFSIQKFSSDIRKYFVTSLKLKGVTTSISNKENTVLVKFPWETLFDNRKEKIASTVIFLRCDFSKIQGKKYQTEVNLITAGSFSFFVKSYDLPTLFANKIFAFLERSFFRGSLQKYPFKGRDIYDLFWLINLSASNQFKIRPDRERIKELLKIDNNDELSGLIRKKLKLLDSKFVYEDLFPLVESPAFLDQFIASYEEVIENKINYIL
ncbi:MAG: nucleotidyl transferase AbiEii/AbiGii toxin family protein [Patescibacteria group bacterium]